MPMFMAVFWITIWSNNYLNALPLSEAPVRSCQSLKNPQGEYVPTACGELTTGRIKAFNPTAIIVIGHGHLPSGDADCHGVQRPIVAAHLAHETGAPVVVFSGGVPIDVNRPLSRSDEACAERILPRDRMRLRGRLSEAEQMCGIFLREWNSLGPGAVLPLIRIEPWSGSTVANAEKSLRLLYNNIEIQNTNLIKRLLVVTSNPTNQEHSRRAGRNFWDESRRLGARSLEVMAVSCGFSGSGRPPSELAQFGVEKLK